jgi:VanZ family protein
LLKPSFRSLARNWWPALAWLGVIRMESTDMASASNTSAVLYKVLSVIIPHLQPAFVDSLDEVLRKCGHFLGYGILSGLVFLALRNANRDRLRALLRRPWGMYLRDWWRAEWALIGILATVVTATYDEIHQTFIPSRTGRWQDVVLDTCGAVLLQVTVYLLSTRMLKRHGPEAPQPQLTPIH